MNSVNTYFWKSNIWNLKVDLMLDNQKVGLINTNLLGHLTTAAIADKTYEMKTKFGFLQLTHIKDGEGQVVGDIDYQFISGKATLTLNGKTYYWKSTDFLGIKWVLENAEGRVIYQKNKFDPDAVQDEEDAQLLFLMCVFLHSSLERQSRLMMVFICLIVLQIMR